MIKILFFIIITFPIIPLQYVGYKYKFPQYAHEINYVSEKYGIEKQIIENLIEIESGGNRFAKGNLIRVDSCGPAKYTRAVGLVQIVPECHPGCKNLKNARENLECGIRYLSELKKTEWGMWKALYIYGGWSGRTYKEAHEKYISKILR